MLGHERVDHPRPCAQPRPGVDEVRADEAEPAGDHADAVPANASADARSGRAARPVIVGQVALADSATHLPQSPGVDADEYRRMAAAGEQPLVVRSTRTLLQQLLDPHLARCRTPGRARARRRRRHRRDRRMDDRATPPTVLADFETDGARGRPRRARPAATGARRPEPPAVRRRLVRRRAVRDRAVPPDEPRPGAIVARLRPGHAAGRRGLPDGAGRQAAVARPRRGHAHRPPVQRRASCATMAPEPGSRSQRSTGAYCFLVPPAAVLGVARAGQAPRATSVATSRGSVACSGCLARGERRCCAASICRSACRRSRSPRKPD